MMTNASLLENYLEGAVAEGTLTYKKNLPLSQVSSFRIGGMASYGIYPTSTDELAALSSLCRSLSIPFLIIGNASNVLFDDRGYLGAVIFTTALHRISREGHLLTADCGVSLTRLASHAAKEGLSGLSFAYGIPGTLGGAVFMNAGAYGGEMKDVIASVSWYDPDEDTFGESAAEDCAFGYRESCFQTSGRLILAASLRLGTADPAVLRAEMEDYMQRRRDKQPLEFPSVGSTFKRYPGYFTGKLIEDAGLKGYAIGGAQVSEKHAGFVINAGGATSEDVLRLIEHIKDVIYQKNGVALECEMRYIPFLG